MSLKENCQINSTVSLRMRKLRSQLVHRIYRPAAVGILWHSGDKHQVSYKMAAASFRPSQRI